MKKVAPHHFRLYVGICCWAVCLSVAWGPSEEAIAQHGHLRRYTGV